MKWAWKIGEYKGISIYIHFSFLLLVGLSALWYSSGDESTILTSLVGMIFILLLFGSVLLHEISHAAIARHYGVTTRDITLLPIGGVARLEKMPDTFKQELWIALAGPAVNVILAMVLYLFSSFITIILPNFETILIFSQFIKRLGNVNLFLAAFNLIPAFPMDGGRILRSILALQLNNYLKATRIASFLGQAIAFIFAFIGLFNEPFLVFIGLLIWIGATQASAFTQIKCAFDLIPVDEVMLTRFQTLTTGALLSEAVQLTLHSSGSQQDFPVLQDGRLVGILSRGRLMETLAVHGSRLPVSEIMIRNFETVLSGEMLQTAFRRLEGCECPILPVLKNGSLAGLLTIENIGKFMIIQSALSGAEAPSRKWQQATWKY